MESLSAPGIVPWSLAITGAGVDWVMSLEPHWFSTIYGMLFMVIDVLAALTFSIIVLRKLSDHDPLRGRVDAQRSNDLGNLMLTFTMLWTYFFIRTIPDHLVRQPERRNSVVHGSRVRKVGGALRLC